MVNKKLFISSATQELEIFLTRSREVNDFFLSSQAAIFKMYLMSSCDLTAKQAEKY